MPNIIYKLINKINGMYYIGQTWQTLNERFNSGHGYKYCTYLNNAITKYGSNNFHYDILAICETQKNADSVEDFFIDYFDSRNRKKGYNLKTGGAQGKLSEETKRKISAAGKGRIVSDKTRQKLSATNKFKCGFMMGKKHSEESKKKIGKASEGNTYAKGHAPWNKGIALSEITKQKLSTIYKGKTWRIVDGKRVWLDVGASDGKY